MILKRTVIEFLNIIKSNRYLKILKFYHKHFKQYKLKECWYLFSCLL